VSSLPIVEGLNVFEDRVQCIVMALALFMIDQLRFHDAEKRLSHGIIPTVPLAANALIISPWPSYKKASVTDMVLQIREKASAMAARKW
jgi:hypothetical protein